MTEPPMAPNVTFKDRTVVLNVFGAIAVLLGLVAAGMALLTIVVQLVTSGAREQMPQGTQGIVMGVFVYAAIAIALIWLGVGSILGRRWARALMLTCSSTALAVGVFAYLMMLVFLPRLQSFTPPESANVPAGFMSAMIGVMMVLLFFVYIVLPGAFVLAYRGRHVKATCEWKDPKPRWTDRCPLPVLAVSIVLVWGGASCLITAVAMPVLPWPGGILAGAPAGLLLAVMGVVFMLLAWGAYRLKPGAWWGLLVLLLFGICYGGYTFGFGGIDWDAYYEAMGYAEEQIETINAMGVQDIIHSPAMIAGYVLWGCACLGYLVYVRRFFSGADAPRLARA